MPLPTRCALLSAALLVVATCIVSTTAVPIELAASDDVDSDGVPLGVVRGDPNSLRTPAAGPLGVHIALRPTPSEMLATWSLNKPSNESSTVQHSCRFCHLSSRDSHAAVRGNVSCDGRATSHATAQLMTYSEDGFAGTIFVAVMTGLEASSRYAYSCGSVAFGWSAWFDFRAAPPPGGEVRVLAVGDIGIDHSEHTMAGMLEDVLYNGFDLQVLQGDISYADDYKSPNFGVQDQFYSFVEAFAARAPFMTVDGNHDVQFQWQAFLHHQFMPSWSPHDAPSAAGAEPPMHRFYFSFDYGPVHWVMVSTDGGHELERGGEQWTFLDRDLAAARQNKEVPWIVVVTHHPMYCSDLLFYLTRCGSEAKKWRDQYEDLLGKYAVDVHLSGHNHDYERSWPVYNDEVDKSYVNPTKPVHIVNGAGGCVEHIDPTWGPSKSRAAHSHFFNTGYAKMHVNATHFDWTWVNSKKHTVAEDHFVIVKDAATRS